MPLESDLVGKQPESVVLATALVIAAGPHPIAGVERWSVGISSDKIQFLVNGLVVLARKRNHLTHEEAGDTQTSERRSLAIQCAVLMAQMKPKPVSSAHRSDILLAVCGRKCASGRSHAYARQSQHAGFIWAAVSSGTVGLRNGKNNTDSPEGLIRPWPLSQAWRKQAGQGWKPAPLIDVSVADHGTNHERLAWSQVRQRCVMRCVMRVLLVFNGRHCP